MLGHLPEDWERMLVIVARPDDLKYGAASAIARWSDPGHQVAYLLVTRGEAGIDGTHPDVAGPLRETEQRSSTAIVGVDDVVFHVRQRLHRPSWSGSRRPPRRRTRTDPSRRRLIHRRVATRRGAAAVPLPARIQDWRTASPSTSRRISLETSSPPPASGTFQVMPQSSRLS